METKELNLRKQGEIKLNMKSNNRSKDIGKDSYPTRAKLIKFIITHIIFKFINCMGMIGMMGMMVRPLETNMQVRIVLFFLKCEI